MNTRLVNTAADVLHAAMEQGRVTPAGLAYALESAQLLQSPETAAELARLRAGSADAAPLDGEQLALMRKRRTHCEAIRFETEDERPVHVWGPSQYPGREMCQRCTTERAWAEDTTADEVVLLAEVDRLRVRVAELEAERPTIAAARDAQIVEWLGKKSREYGTSNRESRDKAEAVWRMADKLSRGAVRPSSPIAPAGLSEIELRRTPSGSYRCTCGHWDNVHGPFCFAEVCECGSFTHPGPEHHDYRIGRDLPEIPHA
ncbi:hypothetical protein ACIPJK_23660 [Streptomyces roseus]|uniref:hypothetical protein n=1 Tax=Streptomyces roseus TaxID=66430 RepID=UPI0038192265